MRFFALTTATADLPEVPDIQESLTAIQKFIKTASPVVLNALWHIALALVIFFVGRWLIEKFLSRVALLDNKTKIDPGVAKFVRSLVRVALWALLIYFIADFLGVPTASFVALLGSIGVTVGLALQGSLSNFAGGLIIMFLHPFKTGDYIKTASDIEGTVVEIGLFFTTLRMADNKIITIPNGNLSAGNIINYNVLPVRRLSTTVGIAYEADTQVFITDNNGNTCEWYPSLDAMSYLAPCTSEAGDYLSFDFTEYAWYNAPPEFSAWLADGWSGMTALGLAGSQRDGMGWITETMVGETSRYAYFSLRFYLEDETGGSVDLEWVYEDSDDIEEMWSGFWTIQTIPDGPSYVTLSLSLVGGNNYGVTDGPMYLCETYPLLISPSGTELLVGAGESGICLPFMSQSTTACVLTQAVG